MKPARVAVVGGGVSGIAAAHYLNQAGISVEILEASSALGGRAGSLRLGARSVDVGGKNIGRRYHRFRAFLREHGDPGFEYFGINSSTVIDGQLHTIDSQKRLASLYHVLRMVGPKDFATLLRLLGVVRRSPIEGSLGGPHFRRLAEAKDHLPLTAWFSARTAATFLRPITLRMNGAEPNEYSLGNLGSNLKMLLDSYDQLSDGMGAVLERFAKTTPVSLGTSVEELIWNEGKRVVGLQVLRNGTRETRFYDSVILALPAQASASLLQRQTVEPLLTSVAYYPVSLVVARYRRAIFTPQVRAIVFSAESPLSNAGCYGASALDTVRYTLSGHAARNLDVTAKNTTLHTVERELNRFVPVRSEDRIDSVSEHYPQGLCAYTPFHHRLLDALLQWEATHAGVALTGDYLRGASIEACFLSAAECVERVAQRLGEQAKAQTNSTLSSVQRPTCTMQQN